MTDEEITWIVKFFENARNNRWSGSFNGECLFGVIKKFDISSKLDMELPIDLSRFKQKRADTFSKVIGQ